MKTFLLVVLFCFHAAIADAKSPAAAPAAEKATEVGEPKASGARAVESRSTATERGSSHKRFHLALLFGSMKTKDDIDAMGGVGFGFSYFFTRSFGVGTGLLFASDEESGSSYTNAWGFTHYTTVTKKRTGWFLNVTFYPGHLPLGAQSSLDFGLTAGLIDATTNRRVENSLTYNDLSSEFVLRPIARQHRTDVFAGPSVAVNFIPNVGMLAEARFTTAKTLTVLGGGKVMF